MAENIEAMTLQQRLDQNSKDGTLSAALRLIGDGLDPVACSVLHEAASRLANLSRPPVDREAVARVISPHAFTAEIETVSILRNTDWALRTADAILALIAGEGK